MWKFIGLFSEILYELNNLLFGWIESFITGYIAHVNPTDSFS